MELSTGESSASLEVTAGDTLLARYDRGHDASKAHFDVLALPPESESPAGRNLVVTAPHDHPWHWGFFFCQKLINGVNCWESELLAPQGKLHGYQTSGPCEIAEIDGRAQIEQESLWETSRGDILLEDDRQIEIHPPDDGQYFVLWEQTLTARDETRYLTSESYHGRYGGLSARFSRELTGGQIRLPNTENPDPNANSPGEWCDYTGKLDGAGSDEHPWEAGITMMHHPENEVDGFDWFTRAEPFGLLTANPVWDETIVVDAGDAIRWNWGVWVHGGRPSKSEIERAYDEYVDLHT